MGPVKAFIASYVLFLVSLATESYTSRKNTPQHLSEELGNVTRNPKFFPLFTLVRFGNEPCRTTNEENGICYTRAQCAALGGVAAGTCARGLGACCQFFSTCGSIINQNQTFFRNPDYPTKYRPASGSDVCQVRIRKQINSCQLRLNFLKFDVDGPIAPTPATGGSGGGANNLVESGTCKTDMLTISSQTTGAPNLCGNLDGQHIYLDFGASDTITLNILLSQNAMRDREWNIEILMIPCRSELRAPSGCLQYFQGVSGQVQSFNNAGGTHLANQAYSICVRLEEGMRSIDWSACNPGDVKITGPTPLVTPQPAIGLTICTGTNVHDYLAIPGGVPYPLTTATPPSPAPTVYAVGESFTDRFCDALFGYSNTYVRTNVKPFVVTVRTDLTESLTQANEASVGFCLKWQQSPNS